MNHRVTFFSLVYNNDWVMIMDKTLIETLTYTKNKKNRVLLRILIVLGILLLVAATGVVASYAGTFAFIFNVPIIAMIAVLVWLYVKKT